VKRPQQVRGDQRRRPQGKSSGVVDIWRSGAPLPDLEPIEVAQDVRALIRSLGEPPMNGHSGAEHYFEAVIERAAAIAIALAFSADLLAGDDD
jgi:hypothetical protein